jgi:hypothetical protein
MPVAPVALTAPITTSVSFPRCRLRCFVDLVSPPCGASPVAKIEPQMGNLNLSLLPPPATRLISFISSAMLTPTRSSPSQASCVCLRRNSQPRPHSLPPPTLSPHTPLHTNLTTMLPLRSPLLQCPHMLHHWRVTSALPRLPYVLAARRPSATQVTHCLRVCPRPRPIAAASCTVHGCLHLHGFAASADIGVHGSQTRNSAQSTADTAQRDE